MSHIPVMLDECVNALVQNINGCYIDGTIGGGGHSTAILERLSKDGRLIGFDRDIDAISRVKDRLSDDSRLSLIHSNFSDMAKKLDEQGIKMVDGLFLDLGVSSFQLDEAERGFSFQSDGPLDMRMDRSGGITAKDWIANADEKEIANVIWKYGEENAAKPIARAIVKKRKNRPITTTEELSTIVKSVKKSYRKNKTHPATLTFQAIRIVVNSELESIELVLNDMIKRIRHGGRLVILTFHSLEDRLVKQFFKSHTQQRVSLQEGGYRIEGERPFVSWLTKKPLFADRLEIIENPRSRSAKLRVVNVEG